MALAISLNGDKTAFFMVLSCFFYDLMNMLPYYQMCSGWLQVIMFAIVFQFLKQI